MANDFSLTSPAFDNDERIPARHSCEGDDVPPTLRWSGAPDDARSFALIMDDPDAPRGVFTHWLLWDIPRQASEVGPGRVPGKPGRNDFQITGYGGPCPPTGKGEHRYRLRLFALDVDELGVEPGSPRDAVEQAMDGHVLAETELVGRYARA